MRLVDSFGRVATDLRISVTDKCNFRCRYCMPPEGLPWLAKDELLTFEEIVRLGSILVANGIQSFKLTGGEPLVRKDLALLVAGLRNVAPDADISLTTNGFLLADRARELRMAGLDRATVSCDSLLRHRFAEITLRDALDEVMRGLEAAAAEGLGPIKINTVVMRGVNDDEVVSFAELARTADYDIRFIEYMPLDAQDEWKADLVVPGAEILDEIGRHYPIRAISAEPGPAVTYGFVDGAPGKIGVISSVTAPFCETCDRLRLTSDGHLRACLFALDEVDLKGPLRAGATDEELAEIARACVAKKWAGHHIGRPDFVKPSRSMSMIGG
ncbi:MAG: GTP 3',8-cyclase MoaA [Actinobacteria bacterium]|nr:GTP 3',8-cyclase MoaA [Actinomycetota bacterium]